MEYNPLESNVIWTAQSEQIQVDTNAMLTLILEEVRSLKDEIQCLRKEVNEIKKLKSEPELKLLPTNMPFIKTEDFEEFDKCLLMDDELKAELKYSLTKNGCKDFITFLRTSLRSITTDELAVNYTWRGTSDKPSVQNFNFLNLLREICLSSYDNATLSEINRVVQQYFLHANDRLKKRKTSLEKVSLQSSPTRTTPSPTLEVKSEPDSEPNLNNKSETKSKPKSKPKSQPKSQPPAGVKTSPPLSPPLHLLPRLPFSDIAELQEFDDKLLDDRNLKTALKQLINKSTAKDYSTFVRSAFREIMVDKLAMKLSWRGTKEKQSIQDFTIFVVIRGACHKRFTDVTYSDINKVCQQHFLHAKDRVTKKRVFSEVM